MTSGFDPTLAPPLSPTGLPSIAGGDELQCGDGHRLARPRLPFASRYDSRSRRSDKVCSAASSACLSCTALREDASESRLITKSWRSLNLIPQQARQPHASQLRPILPPARLRSPARITRFRQPPARRRFCFWDSENPLRVLCLGSAVPTNTRALKSLLLALVATEVAPTRFRGRPAGCTVGGASAPTVRLRSDQLAHAFVAAEASYKSAQQRVGRNAGGTSVPTQEA